ncbi:MAG: hypothetical protein CTY17_03225 [Methylomonas sp.]|nr:MAG: hypothetical protein CTY21_03600 [Methylomonas sp.]PPD41703.1 MAG: hypothetical protein CTY17_03225 [Methylomonas sp.]PPD54516.1 MAG: hypothetical protein CTY11_03550 [Methylomonas sp.]
MGFYGQDHGVKSLDVFARFNENITHCFLLGSVYFYQKLCKQIDDHDDALPTRHAEEIGKRIFSGCNQLLHGAIQALLAILLVSR